MDGLPRCPLDQVIDDREHDNRIAVARAMDGDTAEIGAFDTAGLRMAACRHHIDKGFIGEALFEALLKVARIAGELSVERGMYATDHRCQVWHEGQGNVLACGIPKPLPYLR